MIVLPVFTRELRASARHSFTYYLRVVGAAAALLGILLFGINRGFSANMGGLLFASLHLTLFIAIWIFVPLLTADCISQERREGTLGLLFLTRLRATHIVMAKGLAHGLRAMTLWLAVLPVVTIPVLLGGVGWNEVVLSVMVNFSAICWALAAGLVASAWSKTWPRAIAGAAVLALISLLTMATFVGRATLALRAPRPWVGWQASSDFTLLTGLSLVANMAGGWGRYLRMVPAGKALWAMGQVTLLSLFVLALAVVVAGGKTRRVWQEEPPSLLRLWWQDTFCRPVIWLSLFRRWMRRKLERNPIGWLEQRTWTGRLVTWTWLAVIISLYSAVLTDRTFFRTYNAIQERMGWLLAGSIALCAAGSFRRERETGVLELLLVSPLGERRIISGRLRGLWGQFLPAFGLLLGVWVYFGTLMPVDRDPGVVIFFALTLLTVPVIGLYFSLLCRNFITAFLATLVVGLVMPFFLPALLFWYPFEPGFRLLFWSLRWSHFGLGTFLCQLILAACCWRGLYKRLRKRAFPMERTGP